MCDTKRLYAEVVAQYELSEIKRILDLLLKKFSDNQSWQYAINSPETYSHICAVIMAYGRVFSGGNEPKKYRHHLKIEDYLRFFDKSNQKRVQKLDKKIKTLRDKVWAHSDAFDEECNTGLKQEMSLVIYNPAPEFSPFPFMVIVNKYYLIDYDDLKLLLQLCEQVRNQLVSEIQDKAEALEDEDLLPDTLKQLAHDGKFIRVSR